VLQFFSSELSAKSLSMVGIKAIITGATGMVGEGVLMECLQNEKVSEVLIINRRHYEYQHPKLKELIVPDFFKLIDFAENIQGYDACFFCAGVSSLGMKEEKYTRITYDTTLSFAKTLLQYNSNLSFCYVSGSATDGTEKSRLMWARVKGKTENDLARLPFRSQYNFRPGIMLPFAGQKNWNSVYKLIAKAIHLIAPKNVLIMQEVGRAMINAVTMGYSKNVLEIRDIRELAVR
jgi:nucleoside-diphosphate-sugar epimerase